MKRFILCVALLFSAAVLSAQHVETDVKVECDWGTLSATLATPTEGSDTVVVIVAGSGPTDRNGNSAQSLMPYSYKMLSDGLVAEGYAVFRYDKRAIGRSPIPKEDVPSLLLDDYVDDVMTCVDYLRKEGYKSLIVAGHSEGGLIALIAASRGVECDGVVLLAAPGYPMDEILRTQLNAQLMPQYMGLMMQADMILRRLKAAERIANDDIPKELISLFHSSVQPFLINSMQYNPQQLAKDVAVPMLVISGGHDIQVSRSNGEALVRSQPNAQHVLFEEMTHVLKDWPSDDRVEQVVNVYVNSYLPLSKGLVPALSQFINTLK